MKITAYAAKVAKTHLEPFEYDAGQLGPDEVDVAVTHCGICHTDVGMVDPTGRSTTHSKARRGSVPCS